MSTLIIRNLNDQLAGQLKTESKKRGLSVNRYLHHLIESALRPQSPVTSPLKTPLVRNNLAQCAGGWSQEDVDEFEVNTREFREIDPEMWK